MYKKSKLKTFFHGTFPQSVTVSKNKHLEKSLDYQKANIRPTLFSGLNLKRSGCMP